MHHTHMDMCTRQSVSKHNTQTASSTRACLCCSCCQTHGSHGESWRRLSFSHPTQPEWLPCFFPRCPFGVQSVQSAFSSKLVTVLYKTVLGRFLTRKQPTPESTQGGLTSRTSTIMTLILSELRGQSSSGGPTSNVINSCNPVCLSARLPTGSLLPPLP